MITNAIKRLFVFEKIKRRKTEGRILKRRWPNLAYLTAIYR